MYNQILCIIYSPISLVVILSTFFTLQPFIFYLLFMTYLPGPNFTSRGPKISTLWASKTTLSAWFHLIRDDLNWERLRIVWLSVWFHSIGDDLNWEKVSIVCLSLWFHLISFFSKNNSFRAKMCKTLKTDLFIRYNFCKKYFFPRSIFVDIKWKNLLKTFFLVLTLKIKFSGIFIIIFLISASKYVGIVSFKLIGGKCFSEVHQNRFVDWIWLI